MSKNMNEMMLYLFFYVEKHFIRPMRRQNHQIASTILSCETMASLIPFILSSLFQNFVVTLELACVS